jgi:uncharacterized protein YpbB
MSKASFSTIAYLRARQKAVYDASGFVPEELKTSSNKTTGRKTSSKSREEKPKKEDTRVTTFKLYKQGYSIKKIAKERDLHQRTIYNHLAHFVARNMLPVEDFVDSDKSEKIREVVAEIGTMQGLAAIKKACPEEITYEDITLVLASMESED